LIDIASQITDSIFDGLTLVFNTYVASEVLSFVLAVFVIRKVTDIFGKL